MCADADGLLKDGTTCNLADLMSFWSGQGHEERSFERPLGKKTFPYSLMLVILPRCSDSSTEHANMCSRGAPKMDS